LSFYEPSEFREQHASNRQASTQVVIDPLVPYYDADNAATVSGPASSAIRNHHKSTLVLYEDLISAGVCREQARGVLPQNLYTEYYGTVNLNNILKFIDLRLDSHAQWEIQRVAAACLEIATDLWPVTVGAYRDIRK
tara:strand:+ start:100 stop:510 length:411 start_codon:yes stop_codon:yes gene_type:complete